MTLWDNLQTLTLADPLAFSLTPALRVSPEEGKSWVAPLSWGSALFPWALIGPWLRAGSLIEVFHDFRCREGEDEFRMQTFPEVIYPRWGEWILNVPKSSALILEWTLSLDVQEQASERVIKWLRPWLLPALEVLNAGCEVNGTYLPDFSQSAMRYVRQGHSVELLQVDQSWEFVAQERRLYSSSSADPAEGQWDASSVLPDGQLPAPCVRRCLLEGDLVQQAREGGKELQVDRLRFNVLPRYVNTHSNTSLVVSEGLLEQFAGDAILLVDGPDLSALPSEPLEVSGSIRSFRTPLPASYCFVLEAGGLNQPEIDLASALGQALEAAKNLRVESLALSPKHLKTWPLEALLAALLSAEINAPLEVHLLMDQLEVLRGRKAVDKALANVSDAKFLQAMQAVSARPVWLTEALLQELQGKKGKCRKELREDPAMRGIQVRQFTQLADLVQRVLKQEQVLDSGPYAEEPEAPLEWAKINMSPGRESMETPLNSLF